jgi:hypothetical protein
MCVNLRVPGPKLGRLQRRMHPPLRPLGLQVQLSMLPTLGRSLRVEEVKCELF